MLNDTIKTELNLRNASVLLVGGSENYAWITFDNSTQILLTADQLSEIVKLYAHNRAWVNSQKVIHSA